MKIKRIVRKVVSGKPHSGSGVHQTYWSVTMTCGHARDVERKMYGTDAGPMPKTATCFRCMNA